MNFTHEDCFDIDNIISLLPDHVYWKDKNGFYKGCNDAQALSISLKDRFDIIGKTESDLMLPEQAELIRKIDKEVLTTGITKTINEKLTIHTGEERIFHSKKSAIRNEKNEIIGLLGVSFDITEQLKLEELKLSKALTEQINKAKSIFLAVLNQRAKSALCSISGAAEIIKTLSTDSKIQDTTNIVLDASKE